MPDFYRPYTGIYYNTDTNEHEIIACMARSPDDVEKLAKQWLFDQAVKDKDISWSDYEYDEDAALDSVTIEEVAVFNGHVGNLVASDANYTKIPEKWVLEVPPAPDEPDDEPDPADGPMKDE